VCWGVLFLCLEAQTHWSLALMVFAWSIIDAVRAAFYTLSLFNTVPYSLKYLRYSLFLILYPTGISGEVMAILQALPYFQAHISSFSYRLPNVLNFSFYYDIYWYCILAAYVPGSYILYSYMLAARKKALFSEEKDKDKAAKQH